MDALLVGHGGGDDPNRVVRQRLVQRWGAHVSAPAARWVLDLLQRAAEHLGALEAVGEQPKNITARHAVVRRDGLAALERGACGVAERQNVELHGSHDDKEELVVVVLVVVVLVCWCW